MRTPHLSVETNSTERSEQALFSFFLFIIRVCIKNRFEILNFSFYSCLHIYFSTNPYLKYAWVLIEANLHEMPIQGIAGNFVAATSVGHAGCAPFLSWLLAVV